MVKLIRLAVMERDLACALSRVDSEDEAVDAVLSAAVSYSPDCGIAVFASSGDWCAVRALGERSSAACALAMGGSKEGGALAHLPARRGVSGHIAYIGSCAHPRPVVVRAAALLSAALVRLAAERGRQSAAEERALLESELRHRTRNSLTMIKRSISFLVGSVFRGSPALVAAIDERLGALTTVHDLLSRTCSASTVSVETYFGELAEALRRITPDGVGTVIAYYDAEKPLSLPLERAATIGLVVHELVMNTIKHAAGKLVRMAVRVDLLEGDLLLRYEEIPVQTVFAKETAAPFSAGANAADGGAGLDLIASLIERARGRRLDDGSDFCSFSAAFPL